MSGPATGRRQRAGSLRALSACLLLIGFSHGADAQSLTSDLMRPVRDGFLPRQDSPLRKVDDTGNAVTPANPADAMAPSRVGRIPTYGVAPASGAGPSDIGYDSLNRKRKKPKLYPGAPKPKKPAGPGSSLPVQPPRPLTVPPSSTANKAPIPPAMAGTVLGQPQRRRLKIDEDPFGAVGIYA